MGRDGIEPGAGRPPVLVQPPALGVDLEEGVLEHVVGQGGVAQVAGQVAVQLTGVAADELIEGLSLPRVAIAAQQFFVRPMGEILAGSDRGAGAGTMRLPRGDRPSSGSPSAGLGGVWIGTGRLVGLG